MIIADVIVATTEMGRAIIYQLVHLQNGISILHLTDQWIWQDCLLQIVVGLVVCVLPTKFYRKARKISVEKYLPSKIVTVVYLIIAYSPIIHKVS